MPSSLPSAAESGDVVSKSGRDMRNGSRSAGAAALISDAETNHGAAEAAGDAGSWAPPLEVRGAGGAGSAASKSGRWTSRSR